MPNWLAAVALIAGVLVTCQILVGAAVTGRRSSVSRTKDCASFWGAILNQCVALAVMAAVTAGLSAVDWARIAKASGPRRSG